MTEAVIVSGVRTAIGNYGGSLQDISAAKLGSIAINGAMKKAGLRPVVTKEMLEVAPSLMKDQGVTDLEKKYADWEDSLNEVTVDEVVMGNVLQAGQGQNVARQASIYGGIPKENTAFTVNMVCASGIKAVALAAQSIRAGEAEVIIAGGTENMSSVPYYFPKARWGARMGNAEMVDGMVYDGLWETFYNYHMGITSENIAEKSGVTREDQDQFSVESNKRALAAIGNGIFKDEIVPVEITVRRETQLFDTDEHPRETSMEALGRLRPAFKSDGTITAGNASAITDAAAALVIMSAERAKALGLQPLATIRSYATGGVDPAYMGYGVVPATKKALKLAGVGLKDIDYIELNEAFASQSLGCVKDLDIDLSKTNLHGGGISLGHPIGCTGARIIVTLVNELVRSNLQLGLASLCVGGGMGMAIVIERK
ncbi:MAG: acetyl-CoA C-acetyltransferase [Dehalococcoidales bacterium]|jgi:acetyl-CoA C-acetyltransferase|nr:acetyl-CoA C-acyltransferase [Dehalococcoidales bacterium]MDP6126825.1 acetyl-CoA C-acetyltransferase [Dehalococcoidales bacterium]MDP6632619.1 acetyl-CoA C-acetyltransferase [Dehalococcoidales bacterium]MDP7525180.1 acetyl-CoA C-acetyltransferase [Dehalococcoidales bacterium]